MDSYVAWGMALLVLAGTVVLGLQVLDIYNAVRAVDAAVAVGEQQFGMDGCVSAVTQYMMRLRFAADRLPPEALVITPEPGTPGPGETAAPWGSRIAMDVSYTHPYRLIAGLSGASREGRLTVRRHIATISGHVPGTGSDVCP